MKQVEHREINTAVVVHPCCNAFVIKKIYGLLKDTWRGGRFASVMTMTVSLRLLGCVTVRITSCVKHHLDSLNFSLNLKAWDFNLSTDREDPQPWNAKRLVSLEDEF